MMHGCNSTAGMWNREQRSPGSPLGGDVCSGIPHQLHRDTHTLARWEGAERVQHRGGGGGAGDWLLSASHVSKPVLKNE